MAKAKDVLDQLLTLAPPACWQCQCATDGACDCRDDPAEAKGTGRGTIVRDTPACVDTRLRWAIDRAGKQPG